MGDFWPKNWWKREQVLSYMMDQCKNIVNKKMEITEVLFQLESYELFLNKEQGDEYFNKLMKETKFTIYLDEPERERNV